MKNYKLISLALFALISCTQKVHNSEENVNSVTTVSEKKVENKKIKNTETAENQIDTIIIKNQTAVIIEPTARQIDKRKKILGEEDFYIVADDYMFYLNQSIETFRKNKLQVLNVKTGSIMKFEMENGNNVILESYEDGELWQIYLFDPQFKPKKIDMTDSENEYKTYFK